MRKYAVTVRVPPTSRRPVSDLIIMAETEIEAILGAFDRKIEDDIPEIKDASTAAEVVKILETRDIGVEVFKI